MKRLTALALCLTTVFTLGTSVSADNTEQYNGWKQYK